VPLPCALHAMPDMRTTDTSNRHEIKARIMECVSSKGLLPAFTIAFNEIQKYKSKTREWQRLEGMIMHELANFGIIPRDESEQFFYLIAYSLLPCMDEILAITRLEPSEWDIDMFLMKPPFDSLVSQAVRETFCRLELMLDKETMDI
jgi:hypothetical protein